MVLSGFASHIHAGVACRMVGFRRLLEETLHGLTIL
jgi:hypothetical protein